MSHWCLECEMRGFRVKATRSYISPFSQELTHLCERHYRDAKHVMEAFEDSKDQIRDKAARSYRKAGPSAEAGAAAALSSPQTCAAILGQLLIEPLTPDEVSRITGKVLNTVRARITNMKDFGYVRDTGKVRLATDAGKSATVWEITKDGREWLSTWRAAA